MSRNFAFPVAPEGYEPEFGLNKREYFIGQAIVGLLAHSEGSIPLPQGESYAESVASEAVDIADAVMGYL